LLSVAWLWVAAAVPAAAREPASRQYLTAHDLRGGSAPSQPLLLSAFAPTTRTQNARQHFEGRLTLQGQARAGGFREYTDDYGVTDAADSPHKHLPDFAFDLVQIDQALVPVRRGAIPGKHPYWEFILEPGRVWREAGDGDHSRAALPFALQEVNANCTHNGVLSFLYKSDGQVSQVAYQISSETCAYFKVDLWGLLDASYAPHPVRDRKALTASFRRELAARLPRKPIAELARDFPGVDPGSFGHPDDVSPAHMTTWGVVVDGVHYVGGCPTRAGEYPFCEVLDLPSYSVAKSVFAGLALMRLEKLYPGTRRKIVADYVPECRPSGNWSDVTFENLLDMASGNYRSNLENADESAPHSDTGFFFKSQHREKIDYACNFFLRQDVPGTRWVYRTSDTYILGTAMNAFIRRARVERADIFTDLLVPDIWRPLGLSPTSEVSRRTRDAAAQPFAGFGLTLAPDDVARLALFLNSANTRAEQLLDRAMYRAALQLDESDRGLAAAVDGSLRYDNGFWALRVADLPGCASAQFVPFMSGYSGISIVLLPNGVSYYYFSDNQEFRFRRAIFAAAKIRGYCQPPSNDSITTG
jgi:hypothetical protein